MNVLFVVLGGLAGLILVGSTLGAFGFASYMFGVVLWNAVRSPRQLPVIVRIAFRNLFASRLKTVIVGGIIVVGAVLIVVGTSFVGSISEGMSRSIIGAAAGDLQVYSSKSKDDLAIWGGMGGEPDLAALDDFPRIKKTLEALPNVKAVVPMGISGAMVTSGNTIDLALGELREAENKISAGKGSEANTARVEAQKSHLRHIIEILQGDQKNRAEISSETRAVTAEETDAVNSAATPAFWDSFDKDPFGKLEFLENKIAPQAADADLIYLRYIGTDMGQFEKSFDRMELVDGKAVPPGARGFLFAKNFYEDQLKLKSAKRLDDIKEAIDINHKRIADDADLQRLVRENVSQTREIVLQLDDVKAKEMTARLQKATGSTEGSLEKLLAAFFKTDDANFHDRYDAFYKDLAPMLELYRIRVGDILTIKSFTKSGYVKSVNVKVFGTFRFKGLEKSALAGSLNLMDLNSFRDLYGFLTADTQKEVEAIKAQAGVKQVDRAKAEDELFGAGSGAELAAPPERKIVAETTPGVIGKDASPVRAGLHDKEIQGRVYSQEELEQGAILNAAVFLKDPNLSRQTEKDIDEAGKAAGLPLKAVSWQKAAGTIGQLVLLFWAIFVVASLIIAAVASIIVNNALLTATLERVREFGTLRAIGAQRPFILTTVVIEAMVMGVVFGGVGAVLGAVIVGIVHSHGIGATADIMYFLFSGPRFLPDLSVPSLFLAVVAMFAISAFASLIPAFLAMRVSPVKAMQSED
jgi:ABC-type lipoprotein release transport system permease subunit